MHGTTPESHKELEVKLELVPAGLPALKKIPHLRTRTTARRATEISVYFDTDNQKLRKKGLMLRVRRVGSRYFQTIKASGNLAPIERDEWETEIAGGQARSEFGQRHRTRTAHNQQISSAAQALVRDARTAHDLSRC